MTTIAFVQARMSSSRLPGKVMMPLGGRPAIDRVLDRLALCRQLDEIVVLTSVEPDDDVLAEHVRARGIRCFRGSLNDVLGRFRAAVEETGADVVVRITGDCPLIDPRLVDEVVDLYRESDVDYASNIDPPTYPDGMDCEVLDARHIVWMDDDPDTKAYDREHVTPRMREESRFRRVNLSQDYTGPLVRLTLDELADYRLLDALYTAFGDQTDIGHEAIVAHILANGDALDLSNQSIDRNEGALMGEGQKLWTRAKNVIPGGSMLLSKRAELFAPDQWPAYFSRAKGCRVWDLDNVERIDMAFMGIGTNSLGYGHDEVDAAVLEAVANGNMSTLNAPEEVALAERLVEIHPWADMVRFARSGGEANAIAIRIARAASGRDGVAICGYHGWHDWYLAANLAETKNLDGHLLPGLAPTGVPRELTGTVHPFEFNDLTALRRILDRGDIGVIKMEVMRNSEPEEGYLETIRKWADEEGIVLVFDECTSGFRQSYGGLHKLYGVAPDIAVFGKALGNGYAVTAIVGRREVMDAAQSTFISSTFWTERIGSAAALRTLEVMKRERSWEQITETGRQVTKGWQELADRHGLSIAVSGLPAISTYSIHSERPNHGLAYKTLIVQEMLSAGFLASTAFYASTAHGRTEIDAYLAALDPIFGKIARVENDELRIEDLLKGPVVDAGFKRLN